MKDNRNNQSPFKKSRCAQHIALVLALSVLPLTLLSVHYANATDFTAGGGTGGGIFGSGQGGAAGIAGGGGGGSSYANGCNGVYGGGGGGGDGTPPSCYSADTNDGKGGRGGSNGGNGGNANLDVDPATSPTGQDGVAGAGIGGGGGGGGGLVVMIADFDVIIDSGKKITGGVGGVGVGGVGGGGGAGLALVAGGTITNKGMISGGGGGAAAGVSGVGGGGGVGVFLVSAGTLTNYFGAQITGGSGGGSNANISGNGNAGVLANKGTIDNSGDIIGGNAGKVTTGSSYGANGQAGAGVRVNGTVITNSTSGQITGGAGANAVNTGTQYDGTQGGSGVSFELSIGGSLINMGTITGGKGGTHFTTDLGNAPDGAGVYVASDSGHITITNSGTIRSQTNAIDFQGSNNILILREGSIIEGNINIATGSAGNVLQLDSDTATATTTLEAPMTTNGFDSLIKTGAGSWVVTHDIGDDGSNATNVAVNAGTLILTADNTYTGTTTVDADGILQLGNGGTTGSVQSNIDNNGMVAFAHSDDLVINDMMIQGDGGIIQSGTGDLQLDGLSYSGNTVIHSGSLTATTINEFTNSNALIINGGTFKLGGFNQTINNLGGTGTSGTIDLQGANLIVNSKADSSYAGQLIDSMSTSSTFTKIGTGNLTLTGTLTFPEIKLNEGTLTLEGDQANVTSTIVGQDHTQFNINNHATFNGVVDPTDMALNQGTWNMTAPSVVNNLTNGGTINFGIVNTTTGATNNSLTVNGDYIGNGGTLVMNTQLGGDTSSTDKLIVAGHTSGATFVQINNTGGVGAQTLQGIQLIEVAGINDGTFNLVTPVGKMTEYVSAGGYDYQLAKDTTGWALSSILVKAPMIRPEVAAYLGNQYQATVLFQQSLDDRFSSSVSSQNGYNSWGRVTGAHSNNDVAQGRLTQTGNSYVMQLGRDVWVHASKDSGFHLGLMGSAGHAKTQSSGSDHNANATGTINGYSGGVYGTWLHNNGLYVDSWVQYGRYQNSVSRSGLDDVNYNSHNLMGSLEVGYAIPVYHHEWFVVPQAQVIYNRYHQDAIWDAYHTQIETTDANNITSRLGARLYGHWGTPSKMRIEPSFSLNWWHGKAPNIQMDNDLMTQGVPVSRFETKAGLNIQLSQAWQIQANVGVQMGQDNYRSYSGQLEVQYRF